MVEELARWKASLSQKNKLLLESNKQMLQTCSQLRDMQVDILNNLRFLAQTKSINLQSSNVLDITAECLNISQNLVLHSGIGMPENLDLSGLDAMTDAEKLSIEVSFELISTEFSPKINKHLCFSTIFQALQNSNQTLLPTDEAFRAIVGQAFPSNKVTAETQTSEE